MKKISMILAAASVVLAAASCDKGNESKTDALVEPMVVNITADVMATKTVFNPSGLEDGASVPVLWEGDEILSIAVNENTDALARGKVPVSVGDDRTFASWTYDFADYYAGEYMPAAPYVFYAFTQGEAVRSFYNASRHRVLMTLPSEQTPSASSCDSKGMFLYAVSEAYETWPAEDVAMTFEHATAYGCITLGEGCPEAFTKVVIKADVNIAGSAWYHYDDSSWEDYTGTTSAAPSKTITINTGSKENIWFACRPTTDLASLAFEVYTEDGECYKVEKNLTGRNFTSGKIAKMTISGFAKEENGGEEVVSDVTYTFASSDLVALIGGKKTESPFTNESTYEGQPSLMWKSTGVFADGAKECNIATASGRIKFGTSTNVLEKFSIVITPDEGWIVKSVSINAAVASKKSYNLTAKVGTADVILSTALSTADTDYSGENEALEAGALEISFSNSEISAGVFYISNIKIELTPAE